MVDWPYATLWDDWPTTPRSPSVPFPWMPSMLQSNGGEGNQHPRQQLYGPHGASLQTFSTRWRSFCDNGTSGCWLTKYHVTLLPSRLSSSNMRQSWTSFAITNKPLTTGRLRAQPHVVANPGPVTRVRHSILRTLTGSFPALFFTPISNRTLLSLRKDPWPTKSSRPRRNFITNCVLAWGIGPNEMVFLPCPSPISPTSVTSCGTNTCHRLQITSQSNQLDVFKTPLMVPSFIVRTNRLPLFEYFARAFITNPLRRHSKTLPSLNPYQTNHPQSWPLWLNPFNANTDVHIRGQWDRVASSHLGTFWPKGRKTFAVEDRLFPLSTLHSDQCSTFLLDSFSSSSLRHVQIISLLAMCTLCSRYWDRRLSTPIWFWSIKTWPASSPVLIKTDSFVPGSCS